MLGEYEMSSETNIESERAYKTNQRIESGVHLLVWVVVYLAAVIVVFMDIFFWRT